MEYLTDYVLQGILNIYTDTLKDLFFHSGVNISELSDHGWGGYYIDLG